MEVIVMSEPVKSIDPKEVPKLMLARYKMLLAQQEATAKEIKGLRSYLQGAGLLAKQTRGPGTRKVDASASNDAGVVKPIKK